MHTLHIFVVPPLDGPVTGGTLYNKHLLAALHEQGASVCVVHSPANIIGRFSTRNGPPRRVQIWVDTLFLDAFAEVSDSCPATTQPCLLTHYLPCLVRLGATLTHEDLSPQEREALVLAKRLLVPSEYLAAELRRLSVPSQRIVVAVPGLRGAQAPHPPEASSTLRALWVGNITDGKGLLGLLDAMAQRGNKHDKLLLSVVGSAAMEPTYAQQCRARVHDDPYLADRVEFLGALPPAQCAAAMQASDLLVSSSRMESYGMALAEARFHGLPIVALDGGNVGFHVMAAHGGQLVRDHQALARALAGLVRDRETLGERRVLAWAHRPMRTWQQTAQDFLHGVT